ncbi:hypothetical protein H0A65_10860 [Alcaligenaceae bacterium]|nr:hypothetical protein [Alcaligenaceae bacterium]
MIPGFSALPMMIRKAGGGGVNFSITAATVAGTIQGYSGPIYAAFEEYPEAGSITDNAAPGGGTVQGIVSQSATNILIVSSDTSVLTEITINGTPYALTYDSAGGGLHFYSYSPGTRRIATGNTYDIGLI